MAFNDPSITFGVTGLQGEALVNPTAIDYSKTGNPVLFVTQQDGTIVRLEIARQADDGDADTLPQFVVTSSTNIGIIPAQTQNYNDDGTITRRSSARSPGWW